MKILPVSDMEDLPDACGVYLFFDAGDMVLYAGKSIHLKKRVKQYFRKSIKAKSPTFPQSVEKIGYINTGNELTALLLEDVLIKKYWPPFNKRQKKTLVQTFLSFTRGDFPYLTNSGNEKDHDKRFGPYKDSFFAEDLRRILNENFGIRDCRGPLPSGECVKGALGLCKAPCVNKIDKSHYGQLIRDVESFLESGEAKSLFDRMKATMADLSANMQFEKAAALRDDLQFLQRFSQRQIFLNHFYKETIGIYNDVEERDYYIFQKGRFQHGGTIPPGQPSATYLKGVIKENHEKRDPHIDEIFPLENEPDTRASLFDRGLILTSWLNGDRQNRRFLIL